MEVALNKECINCHGTGIDAVSGKTCAECDGTGKQLVDYKAEPMPPKEDDAA